MVHETLFRPNVENIREYYVEYCQSPHNIAMGLDNGMSRRKKSFEFIVECRKTS